MGVCICECVVKSEHTQKLKHTKVKWSLSFHLRQHCHKAPSLSLDVWLYVTAILWPPATLSLKDVLISVSYSFVSPRGCVRLLLPMTKAGQAERPETFFLWFAHVHCGQTTGLPVNWWQTSMTGKLPLAQLLLLWDQLWSALPSKPASVI